LAKQKPKYRIREACEGDIPIVMDLVKRLAVYEKLADSFTATEELYRRYGWGRDAIFKALIAENESKEEPRYLGFALYYFTFSTFTGKPTLWLEDIYVPEELRGQGVGRAFFRRLAQIAMEKDCGRMEWAVLDWNEPSRRFYLSLGAKALDQWTIFRLTPDAFKRLAES
jgi:GNAT superfamily N-acetyltransferase